MNKYLVGIVIAGVVVVAGGAAARYSSRNSVDTTEKVIYYSEAPKMHCPEIELGSQNEKEAADDVQEQGAAEVHAAVHGVYIQEPDKEDGSSNAGFMTADNADVPPVDNTKPSAASSGSTQSSQQSSAQPTMGNPKPSAVPSGSTQGSPQPAAQKPAEPATEKTTEAVWVVDVPAWTEEYPVYDYVQIDVCSGCGADISANAWEHIGADPYDACGGFHSEIKEVYVGMETVYHEEVGHYEYR